MSHVTIESTAELAELCEQARRDGRIGIDTEFLWERTYSPLICLVQLAVGDTVAIADPLEGVDPQPVADLLADPAVEVVMHAPHADLVGFALRHGAAPTRVFDTQLAAGFVGLSAGLSYERLVGETTGAKLQPSESFSDWSRRPLSAKQLKYAGEDVEHLFEVADTIHDRLDELGRVEWAEEEMRRRFGDQARLVTDPVDAWKRVARRGKLSPKELRVLQEVAAWREQSARDRDMPVSWVLKDQTLVELARRKPQGSKDLTRIRGIDPNLRQREIEAMLEAVRRGVEGEPLDEGPPAPRAVRKRVAIAKGLTTALMRARCEAADIAPELVGTSQDVEELIGYVADGSRTEPPVLLRGWRKEFGDDLVDLIEGRVQLQLSDREPYLLIHP